jgi:glycosyltransferase involved in cell wall biosynthesis
MKNILIFGMTEIAGGMESFVMNYFRNIDKTLFHFDFLCNTYNKIAYEDELIASGSKIFKFTPRNKNFFKYKKELNNFFKKYAKEYDCIWVNVCSLANIDYLKLAKKYGIKKRIIHSHNSQNMDSFARGILHRINRFFIGNYATDFFACSQEAANWFYKKTIINKVKIIKNAIDLNKYRLNNESRNEIRKKFDLENNFVIGNVGRLHFQKNQNFILDVFKEFLEKCNNAKLVLVGEGEDEIKLKQKASLLGIESKCLFVGKQNNIEQWLSAFDVFLFPSLFEGLPISLLEAQANGIPILASSNISKEVKINDNFISYSLKENSINWAKKLIYMKENLKRISYENLLKFFELYGYDIRTEVKKVEKILIE